MVDCLGDMLCILQIDQHQVVNDYENSKDLLYKLSIFFIKMNRHNIQVLIIFYSYSFVRCKYNFVVWFYGVAAISTLFNNKVLPSYNLIIPSYNKVLPSYNKDVAIIVSIEVRKTFLKI